MKISEEKIDRRVEEALKEYKKRHIPKVETKYGNTYISWEANDYLTDKTYARVKELLTVMRVEYGVGYGSKENDSIYILIAGDDQKRAAFIQKYIDNGYQLSWED